MKHWPLVPLLLCACSSKSTMPAAREGNPIEIVQDGRTRVLPNGASTLTLGAAPFTLRFDSRYYGSATNEQFAVRVAATMDAGDLTYFTPGAITDDNPFFAPGTGLAADGPYTFLYIGRDAHHYICYDRSGEAPQRRAKLIADRGDGRIRLEWTVEQWFNDGTERSLTDLRNATVHLMVVHDDDLNNTIENTEYSRVSITFH